MVAVPLGVGVECWVGDFCGHACGAGGAGDEALPDGVVGDCDDDPSICGLE
jgi:hypothetical protein